MNKIILCFIVAFVFVSCEKEYSVENGGPVTNIATGSLQDSAGNCQAISIIGSYKQNETLTSGNYLRVNINFTALGQYTIYSDTVNGYWFYTTGYNYSIGSQTLTVLGYGKPILSVDGNFSLHFKNSTCNFIVPDNNGVTAQPNTSTDYFPTTTNSSWTYFNSTLNDTVYTTVYAADKILNGNTYRQFILNIPVLSKSDTLLYRKDAAGNYYRYYTIGTGPKADYLFLKDYPIVGSTWDSPAVQGTLSGNPTDVRYHFTIVSKNITSTIGANTIDSIIEVKEETQYLENGVFNTKNTFVYSFAKKIGLVDLNQLNSIPNITVPITRWKVY
ncbi:MAG: hypothetical protein ACOVO1_07990 [Chitinophagaceae bacterium]